MAKHFAKWRANTIVFLAGPEAERLAFGLTLSPAKADLLSAKMFTRRCSVSRAVPMRCSNIADLKHAQFYKHDGQRSKRLHARSIARMNWMAKRSQS